MEQTQIKQLVTLATMLASASLSQAGFTYEGGYAYGNAESHTNKTTGFTEVCVAPSSPAYYYYAAKYIPIGSNSCIYQSYGYIGLSTAVCLSPSAGNWISTSVKYGSMFTYNHIQGIGGQAWVGESTSWTSCY